LARYYSQGDLDLSDHYREIFAKCLLCGACSVTCPSGVDLRKVFVRMREQIVNKKGLHSTMERVVQSLSENRNISDLDNLERGEWRDFLDDLPDHMYEKETAEAVYFVGCVASFFPSVQTIPEKLVQIFDAAQVDFASIMIRNWSFFIPPNSSKNWSGMALSLSKK
jgi:heterodisulfide reductase subunit D